ncbi:hypothetical protein Zmor_023483 [Zophobas morio]|uniref:Uncharacterized protein n=1 Tax=Zophobas morio TaxID=2755281 RepID=A0AA38M6G3_9CUCU|nr:hypothetical protein Zmor_023483 [Zophobas morio]
MIAYEKFVFVLGSDGAENGLFCSTRHCHYYVWPNILICKFKKLEAYMRDVINGSVQSGSVHKEKSPGRPSGSEEVVDDLRRLEQNPQTCLTILSQQSGVPVAI